MSNKAFVLIETDVGKTRDVVAALRRVDGITSVDMVTGPYDIIITVESDDVTSMADLVTDHVHAIGGIARTLSCLAVNS